MIAFIVNYNRLTLPKNMADWLADRDCEPIILDNGSDYPPLLEYYADCPHRVVRLNNNFGHKVVWLPEAGVLEMFKIRGRYIVTDPDLDLSKVPDDFLLVLQEGLSKYKQYDKCALSLEINDLPPTREGNFIRGREARYWQHALDERYYHADTDTTLALYRQGVTWYGHSAMRTARPYTARHVPWYYDDLAMLPNDEYYYFKTANDSSSGKARLV